MEKANPPAVNQEPSQEPAVMTLEAALMTTGSAEKTEQPKRRQSFSAVWVVIACGFALMSDGSNFLNYIDSRISCLGRRDRQHDSRQDLSGHVSQFKLFEKHHIHRICRNCVGSIGIWILERQSWAKIRYDFRDHNRRFVFHFECRRIWRWRKYRWNACCTSCLSVFPRDWNWRRVSCRQCRCK
jgi:hypothetical protein